MMTPSNRSEMEIILNSRFSEFKEEIKTFFENQMKTKLDQMINEFQEVKNAMIYLNEKYEEVIQENKLLNIQVSSLSEANNNKLKIIQTNWKDCDNMRMKINDI